MISVANKERIALCTDRGHVFVWRPSERESWLQLPGTAKWAEIGADGDLWCITPAEHICHWLNSSREKDKVAFVAGPEGVAAGSWEQVESGFGAKAISVGNKNCVLAISKENCVYRYTGERAECKFSKLQWKAVTENIKVQSLAVAANGMIVLALSDKSILMLPGSSVSG